MSSRTSSRSTLTIVPSTMSPSLKYLMVRSMAARKSSADPISLIATCGAVAVGVDMWWGAPEGDWSELGQDPGREPVRVSKAAARGWDSFHHGDLERRPAEGDAVGATAGRERSAPRRDSTDPQRAFQPTAWPLDRVPERASSPCSGHAWTGVLGPGRSAGRGTMSGVTPPEPPPPPG